MKRRQPRRVGLSGSGYRSGMGMGMGMPLALSLAGFGFGISWHRAGVAYGRSDTLASQSVNVLLDKSLAWTSVSFFGGLINSILK